MANFDMDDNAELDVTDDELEEFYAAEEEADETVYNLVLNADMDCLNGECDHFCGEPTQADLDRLERLGYSHLVEAYENNIQYI